MTTAIVNSAEALERLIGDLRQQWQQHKFLRVTVKTGRNRSVEQNAKLHAALTDISRSVEWAGKKRDVETWKRLLTAAWCRARGESIEVLPALDGHGVDVVFRRTSELTTAEMAELIEFVEAWAAENVDEQ